MRSLEDVRTELLSSLVTLPAERVPLSASGGRILVDCPRSVVDVPPVDTVGMDGYAVLADDLRTPPCRLRPVGRVAPGECFDGQLASGQAVRVFTGAPLPTGADAVVCQEDTTLPGAEPGRVEFSSSPKPWDFIRFAGEDCKAGQTLLATGTRLGPAALGLLAAAGVSEVSVRRTLEVGLLVTGSELAAPGRELKPGQIYESNGLMLSELFRAPGIQVQRLPNAPDRLPELVRLLQDHWPRVDVLVTSGGASVGEPDLVRKAISEIGGVVHDGEIAMKPGKPFFWGQWRGKTLFGLPGNPVSAFVTAILIVLPAFRQMLGVPYVLPAEQAGILGEDLINGDGRRHFVRVRRRPDGALVPSGIQASHRLVSLAAADGIVDVPPRTTLQSGTRVEVHYWNWPAGC